MRTLLLLLALPIMTIWIFGCSSGVNITSPSLEKSARISSEDILLGAFEISWDGKSDYMDIYPDRNLEAHYNVTRLMVPNYINIHVISWNPATRVLTIRVTVENPTKLDVYDVRGILTNLGNKKLLNPDDYTKLFDQNVPPVANPFRAFAKDEVNRKLWGRYADPGQYKKSEIYEIYFPGDLIASYIITASWPGNADEPYDIENIQQYGTLYESSGSLEIVCDVMDWQNVTADHVILEGNPVTGGSANFSLVDPTSWSVTITNSGNAPAGEYPVWIAAYDAIVPYALYNTTILRVFPDMAGWSDPILVSGDTSLDEILPRIVLRQNDYWIIYSDGSNAMARYSTNGGWNWSSAMTIGAYANIDTLHAVEGNNKDIYVQYQTSDSKYINLSKYDDIAGWAAPVSTSYHGMTIPPYSCDLGIDSNGYIYDMLGDSWSALGFRSVNPYDISSWNNDPIESFYNAVYSANDGFVQNVNNPKMFFIHENTELDYAWYDVGWHKGTLRTGTDTLIEPAIAPESDAPFHGLLTVFDGTKYELEYFRYDTLPPTSTLTFTISDDLLNQGFSSISVKGNMKIVILFDVNGEIHYIESNDGGTTFSVEDVLASGSCAYSHVRIDRFTGKVVAAYAKEESGNYNIYIRMKD